MKRTILTLSLTLILTSCYTSHFTVGNVSKQDKTEVYDRKKQIWIFWGLINLSDGQCNTPDSCAYIITTKTKFIDGIATGLTAGVFSMRSVKVETLKNEE